VQLPERASGVRERRFWRGGLFVVLPFGDFDAVDPSGVLRQSWNQRVHAMDLSNRAGSEFPEKRVEAVSVKRHMVAHIRDHEGARIRIEVKAVQPRCRERCRQPRLNEEQREEWRRGVECGHIRSLVRVQLTRPSSSGVEALLPMRSWLLQAQLRSPVI
jgi:hypothetical protein